jgi:menaquinone-9 beta-reductase
VSPIIERGFVRGAMLRNTEADATSGVRARYVVVADGANSRFGRSLGTTRDKGWPFGTAIRGYWESPLHTEPWIESTLGITDRDGRPLPGYGWVFPLGDGTVNVGVGLLSTYRDFKSVNTTQLLAEFVASASQRWELTSESPTEEPRAARLPMGGSVGPKSGPTYLVAGDAAGTVNPFSGEGIAYAYETGRIAAEVLHQALSTNDPRALTQYARQLDDTYGLYFKVARLFAHVVGRPRVLRKLSRVMIHSRTLMEWMVRIMSNTLQPNEAGAAEVAYNAMARIARLFPDA